LRIRPNTATIGANRTESTMAAPGGRSRIESVLTRLEDDPRQIATLTAKLTPAQLHAVPAAGEWSANDVLAHLRCCDDVWGGAMKSMIDEDQPTLRAVSPRGWITRTNYRELDFSSSFEAFVAQRTELLKLLKPLTPRGWSRTATVKRAGRVETLTVLSYAERLADHEHHHLEQFARIANTVAVKP
jgi:hypothetical protein